MITLQRIVALAAIAATAACGHAAGTRPHDMSEAEHQHAADKESRLADTHGPQFEQSAQVRVPICDSTATGEGGRPVCWTDTVNPTEEHRKRAEDHRRLAEEHRRASEALRTAEGRACGDIAEADRDLSPFAHLDDIRGVEELLVARKIGKVSTKHQVGATVTMNAVPGLTPQWLQRVVDCHLARNAALGHQGGGMPLCPLVPKGVTASVRALRDGFAIDISAQEPATAAEVLRRALLLKNR